MIFKLKRAPRSQGGSEVSGARGSGGFDRCMKRCRPPEIETLNLVAIAIAQETCLGLGFDAFGDDGEGEILAHRDGGFHQLLILQAVLRVADHAAIDVDGIETEAIERGPGGITGAKIVDGDANRSGPVDSGICGWRRYSKGPIS